MLLCLDQKAAEQKKKRLMFLFLFRPLSARCSHFAIRSAKFAFQRAGLLEALRKLQAFFLWPQQPQPCSQARAEACVKELDTAVAAAEAMEPLQVVFLNIFKLGL